MGSAADTNPYTRLLYESVAVDGVEVVEFSRRRLLEKFDVIHIHWPEFLVRWERKRDMWPDLFKVLGLLWLARRRGAAIVWTGHDLEPHSALPQPMARKFQEAFLSMVDLMISLGGPATTAIQGRYPQLRQVSVAEIPHGHYRDVYQTSPSREEARRMLGVPPQATVLLTLGQLRRYKNVPALIETARQALGPGHMLLVAGEPRDDHLAEELQTAAGGDARVMLRLGRLPDSEIPDWHAACDVVVLPYRQPRSVLHSGAAILALSLNRPVVVSDSPTMRELAARVGPDWMGLHNGEPEDALLAAQRLASTPRPAVAPLNSLDWSGIAESTVNAYVEAIAHRANPAK